MFTNLNLTDIGTGYKAFEAPLIKSLQIHDRFPTFKDLHEVPDDSFGKNVYVVASKD